MFGHLDFDKSGQISMKELSEFLQNPTSRPKSAAASSTLAESRRSLASPRQSFDRGEASTKAKPAWRPNTVVGGSKLAPPGPHAGAVRDAQRSLAVPKSLFGRVHLDFELVSEPIVFASMSFDSNCCYLNRFHGSTTLEQSENETNMVGVLIVVNIGVNNPNVF